MSNKQELEKLKKNLDDLKTEILKQNDVIEEKDQEISQMNEKITEQDQTIDDYYSQLQRLQADFGKLQKRSEKDLKDYIRYANENLILKIIEGHLRRFQTSIRIRRIV